LASTTSPRSQTALASLSIFCRNYGRLLSFGRIGHWLGFGRVLLRFWFIPPDQAAAIMAERLGLTPTRAAAALVRVTRRARRVASWLFPLRGQVHGLLRPFYSELDWNDRPADVQELPPARGARRRGHDHLLRRHRLPSARARAADRRRHPRHANECRPLELDRDHVQLTGARRER
jgi:hypothetical protein